MSKKQELVLGSFVFIANSGQQSHSVSQFERKQIRRQAMRHAAVARRQSGTYGKNNQRQYPDFATTAGPQIHETVSGASRHSSHKQDSINTPPDFNWPAPLSGLYPSLPAEGYERARIDHKIDIFSLSALTSIHMSRATIQALSNDPPRLKGLLQHRETSYLDFVPLLYDESALLRLVVDCTMARAQYLLHPNSTITELTVLKLYGKSLSGLQAALRDSNRWFMPDVLCATQILALYELLDLSHAERWLHHTAGAAKLISLRGCGRYSTELERQLLISHTGTIFSESLLANNDCFFEQPEWQTVLSSLSIEEETCVNKKVNPERHPLVTSLWCHVSPVPRLFRQTTNYISSRGTSNPSAVLQIVLEAYQTLHNTLAWREKYNVYAAGKRHISTTNRDLKLRELLGVSLAIQIIVQRLIVALEPLQPGAVEMEAQTQEIAQEILSLCQEASSDSLPRSDLLLAQKTVIARSAVQSKAEWTNVVLAHLGSIAEGRTIIHEVVFNRWCGLLGRGGQPNDPKH